MSRRSRSILSCVVLLAAVFAVFGRIARHEFFALDSNVYLTDNPAVLGGLSWEGVRWAFTTFHAANWHPLTWLSHMVDVQVFGVEPAGHNLVNVALHAGNACLVFLVLDAMTRCPGRSLVVAALFALHPLHVESVAWIVERKDLLSAWFGLLSLGAWTAWVRGGRASAYLAALLLFAAGLLCKPMLVSWPFVLLLLDRWPFDRSKLGARRLLLEKSPWMALAIASAIVTVIAQESGGAVLGFQSVPFPDRVANAFVSYAGYLSQAFWPSGLSVFYPLPAARIPAAELAGAGSLVAVVSAMSWRFARRAPWLLGGWLFFLGTLVPVIGLVQVGWQAHADRYTYLPLIGVFVAVVWSIAELAVARPAVRPWVRAVAAGACLALGALAWRQAGAWKDTVALCEHALAADPRNHVAHGLLGSGYFERGELDRAESELREALRIQPEYHDALDALGRLLHRQGRFAEAEDTFRCLARLLPDRGDIRRDLALSLQAAGKLPEALSEIDAALLLDPDLAPSHLTRGQILEQMGRLDEARAALERALGIEPAYVPARITLARLLVRRGDLESAEKALRRAVADAPREPEARRGLALVLLARGETAEALSQAQAALDLRPGWALAMGDVASILATSEDPALRDPRTAVELAERAAKLTREENPGILDTLAAAYASQERFESAIAAEEKAIGLAQRAGDRVFVERARSKLAAYKEGRAR